MSPSYRRHIATRLATGGLLLIGLLVLLSRAPQMARADAGDLFVSPGGSGDGSQGNPCDLQAALGMVSDGDTIYLAGGVYTGNGGAVVTVTHSLALYGGWDGTMTMPPVRDPAAHPTTMDGEGERRGVYVSGDIIVTLDGFTVANGVASIKGAGLYANAAHLTLRGMTFHSNVISTTVALAPRGGGAMVDGGTLLVDASTFRENSVWAPLSSTGGGQANYGTHTIVPEGNRMQDAQQPEKATPDSPGQEREWLDCIRSREQPSCNVFYHHKVNVPIVLGNLSLKLGRSIQYDPLTEKIVGDEEAARLAVPEYRDPWKFPKQYV